MQKNSIDEYAYGYKGEKELMNLSLGKNLNSGFGGNSIIKTTYRINYDIIQKNKEEHPDREVLKIKNKDSSKHKRNVSRNDLKKMESTKMIKLVGDPNNESQVKSLLESEFKKTQKSNVKWKEKLEKLPQERFSKMF